MGDQSIEALLQKRGAWLKGEQGSHEKAKARAELTRMIRDDYQLFEQVRDRISAPLSNHQASGNCA